MPTYSRPARSWVLVRLATFSVHVVSFAFDLPSLALGRAGQTPPLVWALWASVCERHGANQGRSGPRFGFRPGGTLRAFAHRTGVVSDVSASANRKLRLHAPVCHYRAARRLGEGWRGGVIGALPGFMLRLQASLHVETEHRPESSGRDHFTPAKPKDRDLAPPGGLIGGAAPETQELARLGPQGQGWAFFRRGDHFSISGAIGRSMSQILSLADVSMSVYAPLSRLYLRF